MYLNIPVMLTDETHNAKKMHHHKVMFAKNAQKC